MKEGRRFPTQYTVLTSRMTSRSTGNTDLHYIRRGTKILYLRWVYISDRKSHSLVTPPYHVTSLVTEEEVELKFTAPGKPGHYTFTVCVR